MNIQTPVTSLHFPMCLCEMQFVDGLNHDFYRFLLFLNRCMVLNPPCTKIYRMYFQWLVKHALLGGIPIFWGLNAHDEYFHYPSCGQGRTTVGFWGDNSCHASLAALLWFCVRVLEGRGKEPSTGPGLKANNRSIGGDFGHLESWLGNSCTKWMVEWDNHRNTCGISQPC